MVEQRYSCTLYQAQVGFFDWEIMPGMPSMLLCYILTGIYHLRTVLALESGMCRFGGCREPHFVKYSFPRLTWGTKGQGVSPSSPIQSLDFFQLAMHIDGSCFTPSLPLFAHTIGWFRIESYFTNCSCLGEYKWILLQFRTGTELRLTLAVPWYFKFMTRCVVVTIEYIKSVRMVHVVATLCNCSYRVCCTTKMAVKHEKKEA